MPALWVVTVPGPPFCQEVVAEASRRRETWDAVSRIIPSPEVVLTMPVVAPEDPTISREEWSLLALIDGARTVGELVEVSGAGQFAVVSSLAMLVQRGMLSIHDEDSPDHVSSVRRRQQLLAPLEQATPSATAASPTPVVQPAAPATEISVALPPQQHAAPAQPVVAPQEPTGVPAAAQAPAAVLGGAHEPANVVPPRPEPFMPKRDVDHPEPPARGGFASPPMPAVQPVASASGAAAAAQPISESAIERDPTVNRSLMLRLIAGVRGL